MKTAEDVALWAARRKPQPFLPGLSRSLLWRVHRAALADLARLPPAAPRPPRGRLGLRLDETFVVEYDPLWPHVYRREAELIREFLGPRCREIHHIGSTAVPGLASKPIVDIAVGVDATDFEAEARRGIADLGRIGYRYLGDRGGRGGHFLEKGFPPVRTHAIQLHPAGGAALGRLLRFRDRLRSDASFQADYAKVKAALAAAAASDRRQYVWYKAHWVNGSILDDPGRAGWAQWLLEQNPPSLYRMYWKRRRAPA